MTTVAMTGNDTIAINGITFADLADGNCIELTFPTDIANVKTGKNGNSIYGLNTTGRQCELKIRVIRGSADDKYLNSLLAQQQLSFETTILMYAKFTKRIGDGKGGVTSDTYILTGGVFNKQVDGKSNVEGDTDQSVAMYQIKFSNAPRALGNL